MSRKTKELAQARKIEIVKRRKRNRIVAGAVAVALLGGVAWSYSAIVAIPPIAKRMADWDVNQVGPNDVTFGDPKAPARVTEYGSLTCIHCKNFHDRAFADFKKDYVDTGKVYFVYSHFPYDAASQQAATVVACLPKGEQGAAVSKLYDVQSDWAGEKDVTGSVINAIGLGAEKVGDLLKCVTDGEKLAEVTKTAYESGSQRGIVSTPTFVVNGGVYEGFMGSDVLGKLALDTASKK